MKVFRERKINARGKVLSREEFKPFIDEGNTLFLEERMGAVLKKAESYLEKEPTVIPLSAFRKYMEEGQIQPYSTPWADRLNGLFNLGIAEAFEGKGRFTERLCDYVWATLEMASWVLPEHTVHAPYGVTKVPAAVGEKYVHALELGSIYLAANLATVYYYNKDALYSFSPIICQRIEYELRQRIILPYVSCSFTWEGELGNRVNNWCPWNVSNILLITAIIEKDMQLRERTVEKALSHLDNFINSYKPDGGCEEGPTYWGAAAGSLFDALETLYDMSGGKINVFDEPLIREMGEYIAKFRIAKNRFVNFADSSASCNPDGELLVRYGKKCGSEILVAFGRIMSKTEAEEIHFRHPYRSIRRLMTPIYRGERQEKAAKSVYFPDLQVMIERESEDPECGLLLAIKGGSNGEFHNHNDVGSFIVYDGGAPLLIDAGVGAYTRQTFSPQRYELWFMQSNYHNVAMFDNVGQREGAQYAASSVCYNAKERSLFVDVTGAYPPEAGVKSYKRTAALGEGKVTVHDEISLDGEREIDLVFLVPRMPEIISECEVMLAGERRLEFHGTGYENGKDGNPEGSRRFTAEIEEFNPVGMNTVSMWGTEKLWRIHIRTVASAAEITVTVS
ncbi:MAG: heparinase II/III-family protein [Clostridia bacterium]|nr:heparinase II/III-family protein [Clostridia bacterium]